MRRFFTGWPWWFWFLCLAFIICCVDMIVCPAYAVSLEPYQDGTPLLSDEPFCDSSALLLDEPFCDSSASPDVEPLALHEASGNAAEASLGAECSDEGEQSHEEENEPVEQQEQPEEASTSPEQEEDYYSQPVESSIRELREPGLVLGSLEWEDEVEVQQDAEEEDEAQDEAPGSDSFVLVDDSESSDAGLVQYGEESGNATPVDGASITDVYYSVRFLIASLWACAGLFVGFKLGGATLGRL